MTPSDDAAPKANPNSPGAAVDRYRDLAKWIITSFAGVAALLVAGTQLASLGKLTFADDGDRLLASFGLLILALLGVLYVINQALKVLKPIEISFYTLSKNPKLSKELEDEPDRLPFGAESLAQVKAKLLRALASPTRTEEEKKAWRDEVQALFDYAAFCESQQRFKLASPRIAAAGFLTALVLAGFAWAVNPPKEDPKADAAVPPTPQAVTVTLSPSGQDSLKGALGATCVAGEFQALAIGGSEDVPTLVSQDIGGCKIARFTLPTALGTYESAKTAASTAK